MQLKGEIDVVTLLLRVKVSHTCNFGSHSPPIGIVKSTRHACDRPEFTANGIALKLLRDHFAFWCFIKAKIKKIMNFFTRTLASAKFATVNN